MSNVSSEIRPKKEIAQLTLVVFFGVFCALFSLVQTSSVPQPAIISLIIALGTGSAFFTVIGYFIDDITKQAEQIISKEIKASDVFYRQEQEINSIISDYGQEGLGGIVCFLIANKDILKEAALDSSILVLGRKNDSPIKISHDTELTKFQRDIYLYLRAWLVISLKYKIKVDIKKITRRYPSSDSPDNQQYALAVAKTREILTNRKGKFMQKAAEFAISKEAINQMDAYLRYLSDTLMKTKN